MAEERLAEGPVRASLFGAQYRSCQQELSRGGWFW